MKSKNLWPLGIILTFVLFISGTIALIVIACHHPSDLVSRNYYEDEVRYQERLDSLNRAQSLDSTIDVVYDAAASRITIALPAQHARETVRGSVQLYRPSEPGLDRQLDLEVDAHGIQTINTRDLKSGLWEVKVSWTSDGKDYFAGRKVIIGGGKS